MEKKKRYYELRGKKFDKMQEDELFIKETNQRQKNNEEKQTVSKNILKKEYILVNKLITGH